jgi:hypothetical protein
MKIASEKQFSGTQGGGTGGDKSDQWALLGI